MAEQPAAPAVAPTLAVDTTEREGAIVVGLVGELDMTTVDLAAQAVDDAIARGSFVIVDMTGLRFFSSAGLNLLLQLHREMGEKQLDVRLAGDQRAVARPLELTGLTDLFPIHKTVSDALAAEVR
jgi:anti-sigma B factor antagonist